MHHQKYAVFTMDVEAFCDTECVYNSSQKVEVDLLDGFDEYLKILDRHQIKSTLFTVGSLAPTIKDKLKKHIQNGHRLALHNYEHVPPAETPISLFQQKLSHMKSELEQLFDTEIQGFRAPFFSMDNQHLQVLKELGFTYDSSHLNFKKARHTVHLDLDHFQQLRHGVYYHDGFYEFSLSGHKIFGHNYPISGGGYVRLSNWQFIKAVITQYLRQKDFYVFYLHPFELSQEKIPIPKDLKSYDQFYLQKGIGTYGKHIEQLIQLLKKFGYQFVTFEELPNLIHSKE